MLFKEIDRLFSQSSNEFQLITRVDVQVLHVLLCLTPVVTKPEFLRREKHLRLAPGKLGFGDLDQLLRRVRDELVLQFRKQCIPPDRVSKNGVFVVILHAGNRFSKVLGVGLKRFIGGCIGLRAPPGERRVVSRVITVPRGQRSAK